MFGVRDFPSFHPFVRFLVVALVPALALAPACAKKEEAGFFQPQDFKPPKGSEGGEGDKPVVFDRNNIVDTAALADFEALKAAEIQKFLHRTPYDRPTFLETYQSNGVRASDAIARAARTYRINPLAFLVAAQGTQGLIGEVNYPFPPERVEYVFRCGCLQGRPISRRRCSRTPRRCARATRRPRRRSARRRWSRSPPRRRRRRARMPRSMFRRRRPHARSRSR